MNWQRKKEKNHYLFLEQQQLETKQTKQFEFELIVVFAHEITFHTNFLILANECRSNEILSTTESIRISQRNQIIDSK